MSGILGKAFSVIAVFAVTWGSVIFYWRNSGTVPTGMEMLAYLGLLPVGVSSAGFMLRNAGRSMLDKAVAAADAPDAADTPTASTATDAASRPSSVAVLATDMRLGLDMDAGALLAASGALPRPGLDGRFHDRDGLPLLMCAAADLDDARVLKAQMGAFDTRAAERRAMALLEPVADSLLAQALLALPELEVAEERVVAGLRRRDEQVVDSVLAIELLVPVDWSVSVRGFCAEWLQGRAEANGLDARRFTVDVGIAADAGEVWSRVQRIADAVGQGTPPWYLLLSCSSAIDPGVVAAWLEENRILHRQNKEGMIPGEGAAGVLFATPLVVTKEAPVVWRPQRIELAPQAGAAERRRQSEALGRGLLGSLTLPPDRVQMVLHDADQRSELAVDASAAATAVNPDLDIGRQTLALPVCAGELGPVLPLALLTLAHHHAVAAQSAALILGVSAPDQRLAALVDFPSSHDPSADSVSPA
jgi:hypothetical protein